MQRKSETKCVNTASLILHLKVRNFVGMLMNVISREACLDLLI